MSNYNFIICTKARFSTSKRNYITHFYCETQNYFFWFCILVVIVSQIRSIRATAMISVKMFPSKQSAFEKATEKPNLCFGSRHIFELEQFPLVPENREPICRKSGLIKTAALFENTCLNYFQSESVFVQQLGGYRPTRRGFWTAAEK